MRLIYKPSAESLKRYVDAVWATCLMKQRSYAGFVFLLGSGGVSSDSKKQRAVALSLILGEYMSLKEAAKKTISKKLYTEALRLAENLVFNVRPKYFDIRHSFVRAAIKNGGLQIKHMSTEDMPADVLTENTKHHQNSWSVESSDS